MRARSTILLVLAGVAMLGVAAQPPAEEAPAEEREHAALRERLERTISRSEAMLERHREALERLDAGESPREVLRSLRWRGPRQESARRVGADERAGGPERRRDELSPEARQRLRAFLKEHLPSMDEQLSRIEAENEQAAQRLFERLAPQLREVATDLERDPAYGFLKLAELKAGLAVVDATQRLRSAGDASEQREAAEAELRAAIAARFDARIRLREHELERLAGRLTELHRQIRDEQESREEEIDRVFESIVAQRWGPPVRRTREQAGGEQDNP